jgi:hypothetical protein
MRCPRRRVCSLRCVPKGDYQEQSPCLRPSRLTQFCARGRVGIRLDRRLSCARSPLVGDESGTTSWEVARERLANPEHQRTSWLATTRPDGRPHLMPVIASWIDGAIHIVAGEGTRKARNLAANGRCVIATSSTTLPSIDIVVEAAPIRSPRTTPYDTSPRSSAPAAGHSRPRGTGSTVRTLQPPASRRTRSTGSSRRRCSASPACTGWTSSTRQICRDRPAGTSSAADLESGSSRSRRSSWPTATPAMPCCRT